MEISVIDTDSADNNPGEKDTNIHKYYEVPNIKDVSKGVAAVFLLSAFIFIIVVQTGTTYNHITHLPSFQLDAISEFSNLQNSLGLTPHRLLGTFVGMGNTLNSVVEHRLNHLAVNFLFSVADTNQDSKVSFVEWTEFTAQLFESQDQSTWNSLFDDITDRSSFTYEQMMQYSLSLTEFSSKAVARETLNRVNELQFQQMILYNPVNYELMNAFIFSLLSGKQSSSSSSTTTFTEGIPIKTLQESIVQMGITEQPRNLIELIQKLSDNPKSLNSKVMEFSDFETASARISGVSELKLLKSKAEMESAQLQKQLKWMQFQSQFIPFWELTWQLNQIQLDNNNNNGMSEVQKKIVKSIQDKIIRFQFDILDSDDNGIVTAAEFNQVFKQGDSIFNSLFGRDSIDFDSFSSSLRKSKQIAVDINNIRLVGLSFETLHKASSFLFSLADTDGDGVISAEEITRIAQKFSKLEQNRLMGVQESIQLAFDSIYDDDGDVKEDPSKTSMTEERWNWYLQKRINSAISTEYFLPIIRGFLQQI